MKLNARRLQNLDIDLPATRGELEDTLAECDLIDDELEAVEAAISRGLLTVEENGTFGKKYGISAEHTGKEPDTEDNTPTPDAGKTTIQNDKTDVDREEAVAALRDILKFYNSCLDDTIHDHTEEGEHPERPTTAREYFVERRGWDSDTVDELLLGWAPPNHVDELVAYLHDRGHTREAMLATGAIGEKDGGGGFYTTFNARYVLPYFDADGNPAYAIARVTGGDGGGARGYGGHPADYQAGKYAKLRHTDDRVPFSEPIYGLDTLEEADHVVIAEGIADAITARALGYAVLSPVTRQFKEEHYDPLIDALEEHNVDRVTIVADNDANYNGDIDADDAEGISELVDLTLEEVGAGLDGALRTAANLDELGDIDIRVTLPPAVGDLENDLDDYVTDGWGDLDTLLAAARPPEAFDVYDTVTETSPEHDTIRPDTVAAGERGETFIADTYDPDATEASETTDNIRDIWAAIDRLDARKVARKTITREVISETGGKQTIAPEWAPAGYDGTAVFVDRDKFVDTGNRGGRGGPVVMAAIDAGLVSDSQTPDAVEGKIWWKAVEHLRKLGFDIPQYKNDTDDETYRRDPREVEATVDAKRAYEAAGKVRADDLDNDLPELEEAGDVVHAVALAEGIIDDANEPIGEEFAKVYATAREKYGAPLPKYYTELDAVVEFEAVLDLIGEVDFWDIDTDALNTEITVTNPDEVGGAAVRALNPSWRKSESEKSVLVFDSGNIWDADTEASIDMLRFAALDRELIDDPTDPVEGEHFTEAYRILRDELDAPLPRWTPEGPDHTPMLPDAEAIVGEPEGLERDDDELELAREEVEELIDQALEEEEPSVITALPALGKTTGTIKNAKETPLSYLAPRKELQQQAAEKAERWNVGYEILPVFAEVGIIPEALEEAVDIVRDKGEARLRDRWTLLDEAADAAGVDTADIVVENNDEEEVDLDRPTCDTANGEHGDAWAFVVHVARELGYKPRQIHQYARGLFGAPLPCEDSCDYGEGWDRVTDREDPPNLLIGSYAHAHVNSVSEYRTRERNGDPKTEPRPIVLDEFPGGSFTREFDDDARKFATWLATTLRDDIDDETDMLRAELHTDQWVDAWLHGEADELEGVQTAVDKLATIENLLEAKAEAENILEEVDREILEEFGLFAPLEGVLDRSTPTPDARERLVTAVSNANPTHQAFGVVNWVEVEVLRNLPTRDLDGDITVDVPIDGDLQTLVEKAAEAVRDREENAKEVIHAAKQALTGGPEGCEALAAWADAGYAHPDAHHFLKAVATPTGDEDGGDRVHLDAMTFDDAREETVVDRVKTGEKAVTILDRNGDGALLHTPPNVSAPIVGLDATARRALWRNVLREDVTLRDIHDTDAERAEFLEEVLGLSVVQTADKPRFYEGDAASKDTEGDVALLETIAEEYRGVRGARDREEAADIVDTTACITSKSVEEVLKNDERLEHIVDTFAHYGDVQGRNDLKDARLAAILGTQHYGDDAIEKFAVLDGREVNRDRGSGRGAALDYGDELANEYLRHMTEDQTMQAILRFARGGSGATVVARTSALRGDLPVIGKGQVVQTWSDTATTIAREYRRYGDTFTVNDVAEAVDVSKRQVRRVLDELEAAGYITVDRDGRANEYEPVETPDTGEVDLLEQTEALANNQPGQAPTSISYTWNVRVTPDNNRGDTSLGELDTPGYRAPPAPSMVDGVEPPS